MVNNRIHRCGPPIRAVLLLTCAVFWATLVAGAEPASGAVLKIGFFPNITHAQGLIGAYGTKGGGGWFEERIGEGVRLQWFAFNAGPSAMEAILAGTIDLTYVGPNPALNAYIRSKGREVRVVAGATDGGAALVVAGDGGIRGSGDFKGKRLATPQLGNTQDVAARAWLLRHGYRVTLTGGDVQVIPTANPDQLALFQRGKLDAVWTVEPWVSRLEMEAKGRILLEQPDALIALLVASEKACARQPALVAKFVAAHSALTRWLNENPDAARDKVRLALSAETRREVTPALVASAWKRLRFNDAVDPARFNQLVADAQQVGFLRDAIPLDLLFSRKP